ncbi:conjugal transfer protein TraG N-terminal domain-containing protein [Vibrio maritimus]|uniref:conjugal transfer protein TraG N-terminal domain-containing protein n=1 Tax=Vibrio maritimus TaxID=990268 RepID=UPI004068A5FF
MNTFEYYTYSQGTTAQKALNGVASYFGSSDYGSLISISLMIGAVATLAYFMTSRDPKHIYRWMAVFVLVPMLLINTKARMQIVDLTSPGSVQAVDNVPYLVALPTWAASTMMVSISEGIEAIFTTTDAERYGKTGMLFGSELFLLSRQALPQNAELRSLWRTFTENCIYGDIYINHKYTLNQFITAPDVFGFLDNQSMSPLRSMYFARNDWATCEDAYPRLKTMFENEAQTQLSTLGTFLFGQHAAHYQPSLENALTHAYSQFIGISNSAVDVLKQNMAINTHRFGISSNNQTAQALNYAYTSNKLQQTSMMYSIGLQAREFVPIMHTFFFLIFSVMGLFVGALALLPALTVPLLKRYVQTFIYLASWPPMFAVVNALMLWSLEGASVDMANLYGGLTLKNADPLVSKHTEFAAYAGYMMMSVPALAIGIVKGGNAVMSSMSYQLAGMINSTNARTSAASSSGNIDFGNLQMQSHNYNNTHANKYDDNLLVKSGVASLQQADGSMTTTYLNDGNRQTYHSQGTISEPIWLASTQSSLQSSISDQFSNAKSAQTQHQTSFNDAIATGAQINDRWNDAWSHNQSYGNGHQLTTDGQISQAHNQMNSAIDSLSNNMGWTQDQSRAYLQASSGGFDASVGLPKGLGVGLGVSGGVKWSDEEREAFSHMTSEQRQALEQATTQYSEGATSMQRAGQTLDAKDSRSDMEQYAHDFALNYQRTQTTAAQVNQSNSEVDTLSNIHSRVQNDSSTFSLNTVPGFQAYLEKNALDNKDIQRLMTATSPEDTRDAKEMYDMYLRSNDFRDNYGDTPPTPVQSSIDDIKAFYQQNDLGITKAVTPEQTTLMQQAAALQQEKQASAAEGMRELKGSDDLYHDGVRRNIEGNAAVWGGELKGQAEPPLPPQVPESNSEFAQHVESHTTPPAPPEYSTAQPSHGNYPLNSHKDT